MPPKSRKEEYAEITKQALLDAALEQFILKGYSNTSIEDIVQHARVTRGALYHHFSSKEEIFIVVYKGLVKQLVDVITDAIKTVEDPWEKAFSACKAFLDYCIDPNFKSIRLNDAIGVLGWKRWREIDSSYTMGLLRDLLKELMDSGDIAGFSEDYTANMLYALLVEAALTIAAATDKLSAHVEVSAIVKKMLTGLKA